MAKPKNNILLVYAILIVELLITFATMFHLQKDTSFTTNAAKYLWLIFLVTLFLLVLPLGLLTGIHPLIKLGLFTLLSFMFGFVFAVVASKYNGTKELNAAIAAAIGVFVLMTLVALIATSAGFNLDGLGIYLLVGLFALIIARLFLLFFNVSSMVNQIVTCIAILLFSLYVVYDTNVMIRNSQGLDSIDSAVAFYLDFINVFINILNLES